ARVVLTTVGPYTLYGEPVLAACIAAGTDYADLCGEPLWMRAMIAKYGAAAKVSGSRVSFSSGFDSIPFELGVVMLQRECAARFGGPATRVKARMRGMKGTFSGGTAASLRATMGEIAKDNSLFAVMGDPFALTEDFVGPVQPDGSKVAYDEALHSWAAPFFMAAINTKNVHRSNFLLGHAWGQDFRYDEMVLTGDGEKGEAAARFMGANKMIGGANDPKPGEGPSLEERQNGFYDLLLIGEMSDGRVLHYAVKGRYDPGYGSTCRMITETGMALLASKAAGGIATPGAILGADLAARLAQHAQIQFAVEE
ncbi:MAG: hypothetical protein RLY97_1805, partial [Pseudomonadota bacterium]